MENLKHKYHTALTIAGSDPVGGAGLQADLKTFSALGCYGMTAVTALVDENTVSVRGIYPVPVEFVQRQIRSVMDDIGADAIKIGMLHSAELVRGVREVLDEYAIRNIVLDPVMVATSGDRLLEEDAVANLRSVLAPRARVLTPNLPEAEILLGATIQGPRQYSEAARSISMECGGVSVLLKSGHSEGEENMEDLFYNAETDTEIRLPAPRIDTVNTHGTGCTLSSAVAAGLAKGLQLDKAVVEAKAYITRAIEAGARYKVGSGHGPVHHFHSWW